MATASRRAMAVAISFTKIQMAASTPIVATISTTPLLAVKMGGITTAKLATTARDSTTATPTTVNAVRTNKSTHVGV